MLKQRRYIFKFWDSLLLFPLKKLYQTTLFPTVLRTVSLKLSHQWELLKLSLWQKKVACFSFKYSILLYLNNFLHHDFQGTFGHNVQQIIFSKDGHTWSPATWPCHCAIKMQSTSLLPWIWMAPVTTLTEYSGNDAMPVPSLALKWPGSFNFLSLKNEQPYKCNYPNTNVLWEARDTWKSLEGWDAMWRKDRKTKAPGHQTCEWTSHVGSGSSSLSHPMISQHESEMNHPAKAIPKSWATNHEQNKIATKF